MAAGLPPDPPLDPSISAGQAGHIADHEAIAGTLAMLGTAAGSAVEDFDPAGSAATAEANANAYTDTEIGGLSAAFAVVANGGAEITDPDFVRPAGAALVVWPMAAGVTPNNAQWPDIVNTATAEVFNPLTQVTPLHAMWADDPAWTKPADGAAVDSWRNTSGGGDPAMTGTNRPTYDAAVPELNDRAAIVFDAASSQRLLIDITDQAQPWKMLVVFRFTAVANSVQVVGTSLSTASHGLNTSFDGNLGVHAGTAYNVVTPATTNPYVFRGTFNGASTSARVNEGTPVASDAGTGALARIVIGAGANSTPAFSRHMSGQVAFLGFYDSATDDGALATLAADLKTYYGIA